MMRDREFKEKEPKETIRTIKNILKHLGVDIEEEWVPESTVNTFSVRVNIKGTQIGTNGKGVSKEFALASAYGEFMERIQNKALGLPMLNKKVAQGYYFVYDEKLMTVDEIVGADTKFIENLLKQLKFDCLCKEKKINQLEELLAHNGNEGHKVLMYPFYNYTQEKVEYLPFSIIASFYGTNGMCAGNTMQEALVQGFSEIFERYVQRRVIEEKIALPNVPEEYIKKYEHVYRMYQTMKKLKEYGFYVKDASLGLGFPVVAIVIVEKNTGRYGVHFGAHPDFGIALERAFTEASQGRDILKFAQSSKFDFSNSKVNLDSNLYNLYDIARGQYPYQFFSEDTEFIFKEYEDVSGKNNEELLNGIFKFVLEKGYSIYIRDVSFLGMCAYHIIIPELSDLISIDERTLRARNTLQYVEKLLVKPSKIETDDLKYIVSTIQYFCLYQSYSNMSSFYTRKDGCAYPFEKEKGDILFFLAISYAKMKDYAKAVGYLEKMLQLEQLCDKDRVFLSVLIDYFIGRNVGCSHSETRAYLMKFYDALIVENIGSFKDDNWKLSEFFFDDIGIKEDAYLNEIVTKINKIEYEVSIKQKNLLEIATETINLRK